MFTNELTLTRGGRFAVWLAVAGPVLAALSGIANTLALVPADALWHNWPVNSMVLFGLALGVAILAAITLQRGIRSGGLAPTRIVLPSALPWLAGMVLSPLMAWSLSAQARDGGGTEAAAMAAAYAEAGVPRLIGALLSWSLAGSLAAALAIAGNTKLCSRRGRGQVNSENPTPSTRVDNLHLHFASAGKSTQFRLGKPLPPTAALISFTAAITGPLSAQGSDASAKSA